VRRTTLTIVATIIGLVMLLQFKTHTAGSSTGALASLGTVPAKSRATSQPHPPRHHQSRHPTSSASARTTPAPAASARTTPATPRTITAAGRTVQTQYGPVQVRIVETAGRLTDVTAIQLPSSNAHSAEIAANAVPILRSEALHANSARIDVVSGATYTSNGYAQSLQSALDNA
jgi:uncharacterized protein with FMN-binding domain